VARNQYPQDEFDDLPEESPKGVHRRVPRPWARFVNFVVIIVAFIGLAWGTARLYLMADDISWLHWLRDVPFVDNNPDNTPGSVPTWTPEPSPSPSLSYDLDLDAAIVVFNTSGRIGLANEVESYLVDESDFTDVSTGIWGGDSFTENAVLYQSEDLEDSARYIAELLGIDLVDLGSTGDANIAVILISEVEYPLEPSPSPSPSASP
jgi:hypothetical protein